MLIIEVVGDKMNLIQYSLICVVCFMLSSCGNKFEECIQVQQEKYRAQHPNASYAEVSRLRGTFEAACSDLK